MADRPEEQQQVVDNTGDVDEALSAGRAGSEAAAAAALPPEHVKLEVQVHSQFQLLWAVFRSHSTAEDEMIWPALKEKARSTGGKVCNICVSISS